MGVDCKNVRRAAFLLAALGGGALPTAWGAVSEDGLGNRITGYVASPIAGRSIDGGGNRVFDIVPGPFATQAVDGLGTAIGSAAPRLDVSGEIEGEVEGGGEGETEGEARPWQNAACPEDVNGDGTINATDSLVVINDLNNNGPRELPAPGPGASPPPYLDVNGDGFVSPLDSAIVIEFINANGVVECAALEGEAEGAIEGEGAAEGEAGPAGPHSADPNGDGRIVLSELLRVIQFYNSSGYGCETGTEDDFAPNDLDQDCVPHDSDYNPQDWRITLTELLRLIQFYNSGAYFACPGQGSEDGYCPGTE